VNEVMEPWVTVTIDGLMETLNAGETWACRQEAKGQQDDNRSGYGARHGFLL